MREVKKDKILLLSLAFMVMAIVVTINPAWAKVSLIKSSDVSTQVDEATTGDIQSTDQSKSHAPEPTTLALFGSGFLGMILTFVRRAYAAAKRFLDFAGAIVALLILSPLMLLVTILIKVTSRGPVLYKQTRVGKDGQNFEIYKFRSMRTDAEINGPQWAKANDNRLTPIGAFLRKSHIDEIPQFINVLKGDMSIIGPRPERPVFVEKFKQEISDYEKRLDVKPGITGLAQVWHRYDETIADVRKKIKYDLLYIKKMCLWTDFLIVLRTFRVIVTGEGAR